MWEVIVLPFFLIAWKVAEDAGFGGSNWILSLVVARPRRRLRKTMVYWNSFVSVGGTTRDDFVGDEDGKSSRWHYEGPHV